jgi:type I restriction enzyme S subunit
MIEYCLSSMTKRATQSASESIGEPEIPPSWTRLSLGEIGRWVGGGTPSRANIRFWTEGSIPWVSPKDMKTDRLSSAQEQITEAALAHSATHLVEKGSVLLVVRSGILEHTLPVAIADRRMALNQDLKAIEPMKEVDSDYLALALRTFSRTILRSCAKAGTTVASLELPELLRFQIPVAPFQEQLRIVAEIEKQFTRLEAGVAALRRVQANLKRYRAAVLKAACEGRLVRTKSKIAQTELKDIIGRISQGWSPKCDLTRDALPKEWAIITTTAVQSMRYIDNQGKPLPSKFEPRPHIEIKAGDFLMTRKGPRKRAGVACLVRATRSRLMVCDTVYRFRCDESRVVPVYLELALNSPSVVEAIDRQKAGISESGVSLTHDKLGGVLIPVPSLAEQSRIVAEVERRLSVVEEFESVVSANLQRAKQLQQSILNYAFQGKLGTQNKHDRPVAVLSDHLKFQRTMKAKTKIKAQRAEPGSTNAVEARVSLNEALRELPKEATLEQLCRTAGYNPAITTDVDDFFQEVKAAIGKLFVLKRSENDDVLLRKVSR